MDELSLINGMKLTDQVKSGSLIKLVEYDYLNRGGSVLNNGTNRQIPTTTNPAPRANQPTSTNTNTNTTPNNTGKTNLPPPPRTRTQTQTPTQQQPTQQNGKKKTLPGKIKKKN